MGVQERAGLRAASERDDSLDYRHIAYHIGLAFRALEPELYRHLVGTMMWVDDQLWREVRASCDSFFPEIEYIVYDVTNGEQPGVIGPHVDNMSAVTLICMLSDESEFEGGVNCFAPPTRDG